YKLKNKNKILVSWEDAGLHYRIINVNQKLSGRTTQNTPIPSSIFRILPEKNLEESVINILASAECEKIVVEVNCTGGNHPPGDPDCLCQITDSTCERAFISTYY